MEAVEFGRGNSKKIVLIPGNMMSWRQFEKVIPELEKDFHVIAVSTDGFDGKSDFTVTESSAVSLEKYIEEKLNGHIHLVFGESFGSATAGIIFHRQKVKVDALIMNGPQYMNLGILNKVILNTIPNNQHRLVRKVKEGRKSGKMPLMMKLYTRADDANMLEMFKAMPDNISLNTLRNCMSEALKLYDIIDTFEPDPDAKVSVWYGAKEPNMKTAVKKLLRAFPNAENHPFEGMGHGDIIGKPELMAVEIKKFMER